MKELVEKGRLRVGESLNFEVKFYEFRENFGKSENLERNLIFFNGCLVFFKLRIVRNFGFLRDLN